VVYLHCNKQVIHGYGRSYGLPRLPPALTESPTRQLEPLCLEAVRLEFRTKGKSSINFIVERVLPIFERVSAFSASVASVVAPVPLLEPAPQTGVIPTYCHRGLYLRRNFHPLKDEYLLFQGYGLR
jgi:hypothetical protein